MMIFKTEHNKICLNLHSWNQIVFYFKYKDEEKLDLSEINQINIEDTETFHRIPKLSH